MSLTKTPKRDKKCSKKLFVPPGTGSPSEDLVICYVSPSPTMHQLTFTLFCMNEYAYVIWSGNNAVLLIKNIFTVVSTMIVL